MLMHIQQLHNIQKDQIFIATLANIGDIVTNINNPKIVPIKENTTPTPKAFPACPFAAKGVPSNVVAIEDGVPGIFNKIAATNPPEIPPTYKAINVDIPCIGVIVYVTGKNIIIAIVAVSPGTAPKNNSYKKLPLI